MAESGARVPRGAARRHALPLRDAARRETRAAAGGRRQARVPSRGLRLARTLLFVAPLFAACDDARDTDAPNAPRARHLLLITIDTLRADRLGCYGGPNAPTPHLDRLAAEGVLFEDAYAQRSMTLPSMTSFFTSKYTAEHGVISNSKVVRDEEWTLAERLRAAGFATHALNVSAVLAPDRGNIEQGFDDYEMIRDERDLTDRAVALLGEDFGAEQPQFLWLHFVNPHVPYRPPAPWDSRFTDGRPRWADGTRATLDRVYLEKLELTDGERRHVEALYDGAVAFVDACVGRIVDALDAADLAEDTLVVVTSDHGEDLLSHNHYSYHSNSVYRSSTRIPLIVRQPGRVVAGHRARGAVESVDLMPTVLSWLGVAPAAPDGDVAMRGVDLAPVLADGAAVRKPLAFSVLPVEREDGTDYVLSARSPDWAYVWNEAGAQPRHPPERGEYPIPPRALYDLAADPDEQRDVLAEHPDVAARLHEELAAWWSRIGTIELDDVLDDARRRDLEQLGYLAPADDGR